jgi:hypothetical protein
VLETDAVLLSAICETCVFSVGFCRRRWERWLSLLFWSQSPRQPTETHQPVLRSASEARSLAGGLLLIDGFSNRDKCVDLGMAL